MNSESRTRNAAPPRPPNILWIVTTQWRAQAAGYAGDANARTPHLDRLAAESVNYAQAVTPHPFGPFARAALYTGVPAPANGVRDYFDPLPPEARTDRERAPGPRLCDGVFRQVASVPTRPGRAVRGPGPRENRRTAGLARRL